ncbi:MAG: hypothetical protein QW607_03000 [Desulfurococcaceae archaeon]
MVINLDNVTEIVERLIKLGLLTSSIDQLDRILSITRDLDVIDVKASDIIINLKHEVFRDHKDVVSRVLHRVLLYNLVENIGDKTRLFIELENDSLRLSINNAPCLDVEKVLEDYVQMYYQTSEDRDKVLPILYFEYLHQVSEDVKKRIVDKYEALTISVAKDILSKASKICVSPQWIDPRIADVISIDIIKYMHKDDKKIPTVIDRKHLNSLTKILTESRSILEIANKLRELGVDVTFYIVIDGKSAEEVIRSSFKNKFGELIYKKLVEGHIRWGSVYEQLIKMVIEEKDLDIGIDKAVKNMNAFHQYVEKLISKLKHEREDTWLTMLNNVLNEMSSRGKTINYKEEWINIIHSLIPSIILLLIYDIVSLGNHRSALLSRFINLLRSSLELGILSMPSIEDQLLNQLTKYNLLTGLKIDEALKMLINVIKHLVKYVDYEEVDIQRGLHFIKLKISRDIVKDLGEVVIRLGSSYVVLEFRSRGEVYILCSSYSNSKDVVNLMKSLRNTINRFSQSRRSSTQSLMLSGVEKSLSQSIAINDPDIMRVLDSAIAISLGVKVELNTLQFLYEDNRDRLIIVKFGLQKS